ncbi:hypothetical protein B0G81_7676 [Paraburkholderia sp. BL6665CI2N2]|uniref:hypothetical protein n=1 Tax=Paraburkholderia sp. BL6665CI2N2 TaxID=1938806 RepID=UPI00106662B6|nr:hypothetical protein [Paraburkholderia sp. BL6665CI2N2]TDY27129.1 hypothetical protein B0G81_7676 [Paraburkholderia sp. BL6665CI2N2]
MKKILIAAAVVFSTGVFAGEFRVPHVHHEMAAMPTNQREAEIASLFDRCNAALVKGDADSVAKVYAPDPEGITMRPHIQETLSAMLVYPTVQAFLTSL